MDREELQAKIKQLTDTDNWCTLEHSIRMRSLEEIWKLKLSDYASDKKQVEEMTEVIERIMLKAEALFIEEFSAIVEAKLEEIK